MKTFLKLLSCALIVSLLCSCSIIKNIKQVYVPEHRLQWWLDDINWNKKRVPFDGSGVRVAIIDSGIDVAHPDLKDKVEHEYRVPTLMEEPETNNKGHGTAVAGIIAAYPSDKNGVLGIAPGVRIISIDVTDDREGAVEVNSLIQGIEYAIEQGVQIINVSLGFNIFNEELQNVVKKALDKKIILVASSGNDMEDTTLYPAKFDGVFSVGAYKKDKKILSPKDGENGIIYLPGEYIVTTYSGTSSYTSMRGTSIAAPMLTGVIALLIQKNPDLTINEIKSILKDVFIFDVIKILERGNK